MVRLIRVFALGADGYTSGCFHSCLVAICFVFRMWLWLVIEPLFLLGRCPAGPAPARSALSGPGSAQRVESAGSVVRIADGLILESKCRGSEWFSKAMDDFSGVLGDPGQAREGVRCCRGSGGCSQGGTCPESRYSRPLLHDALDQVVRSGGEPPRLSEEWRKVTVRRTRENFEVARTAVRPAGCAAAVPQIRQVADLPVVAERSGLGRAAAQPGLLGRFRPVGRGGQGWPKSRRFTLAIRPFGWCHTMPSSAAVPRYPSSRANASAVVAPLLRSMASASRWRAGSAWRMSLWRSRFSVYLILVPVILLMASIACFPFLLKLDQLLRVAVELIDDDEPGGPSSICRTDRRLVWIIRTDDQCGRTRHPLAQIALRTPLGKR